VLSFKEFLLSEAKFPPEEVKKLARKEDCKVFVKSSGIQSLMSPHANEREVERDLGRSVLEDLIKQCLDYTSKHPAEAGKTKEVLFYSSKLKQAVIASYRKDLNGDTSDREKYLFLVTFLPRTKNVARNDTHKISLEESIQSLGYTVDNIIFLD